MRRCQRQVSPSTFSVVSALLILALSICDDHRNPFFVNGQRAIASLGSKIKNQFHSTQQRRRQRHGSSSDEEDDDDDIIIKDDHVMAMGGLDHVDLSFQGIKLELETKKKKNGGNGNGKRLLLDGSIVGRAKPGRMVAIMGPSGAGKSTILHALAGRIKENPKIKLSGERYVNGQLVSGDSMIPCAFVTQQVNFFPYMTVRETLTFRVELKLGSKKKGLSKSSREQIVDDILQQVNLQDSADTIVGDSKIRGISGGERRRLAIACELIAGPSIIFLDEPTTGKSKKMKEIYASQSGPCKPS